MNDNRLDIEIGDDETLDEIRGIKIIQKKKGYRFSEDSVLLADFLDLAGIRTVADLGTGSGIIAILLAARSAEIKVTGIELQESLYSMAVRNIRLSSLSGRIDIVHGDIRGLKDRFTGGAFDLVVSNPPFFQAGRGRIGHIKERTVARHEVAVALKDIVASAVYLLKEGGRVALVYPVERRGEVVSEMNRAGLGPARIREVYTKGARVVMVEGRKGYAGYALEEPPLRL